MSNLHQMSRFLQSFHTFLAFRGAFNIDPSSLHAFGNLLVDAACLVPLRFLQELYHTHESRLPAFPSLSKYIVSRQ